MGNKYAKGVVYLNTPIRDIEKDIIGVDAYVDKIESAIDEGAQMIAVTSPFGTGKTRESLIKGIQSIQHAPNKRKSRRILS